MCLNPIRILNEGKRKETTYIGKKGEKYTIACYTKCGNCSQCIAEKANNWVIRNKYEEKAHTKKCFITLTYSDSPYFLIKKHLQDFLKRFRKGIKEQIRYFACGEYGVLHNRPHLHIILYGWEDPNAKWIGTSKKGNPIFKSEYVDYKWGFGKTTYQVFNEKESAYIALYNTARETEKRDYIISTQKAKELIKELKQKEQTKIHRFLMIRELQKELKKKEVKKSGFIKIKEFNTWSKALGWQEFEKEYKKQKNYDFKEYIQDKEFLTPSPWIKKLANKGDSNAIQEMLRRTAELTAELTSEELARKNRNRKLSRKKNEIIKFAEDYQKINL